MASAGSAAAAAAISQSSKSATENTPPPASSTNNTTSVAASKQKLGGANGSALRPKSQLDNKVSPSASPESNNPDRHAHDRLIFLVASFVSHVITVTIKSGETFKGVCSSTSLESNDLQIVLKMTKKISSGISDQLNGGSVAEDGRDGYIGLGDDHVMTFDLKDVVDINAPNVSTDKTVARNVNGTSSSFRTDTEISGNTTRGARELQQWEPSGVASTDLNLNGSTGHGWNQFEANERLYGVKTNYDENFYTTSIDRSSPSYKERAAAAEAIARRIEGSTTTDAHVAEERGVANDGADGLDEEDRYSGVRRDAPPALNATNRYTPPARRPLTSTTTAAGPPVDPAIISSQIAKPEQSPQKHTTAVTSSEKLVENSSERALSPVAIAAGSDKKDPSAEARRAASRSDTPAKPASEQKDIDRPIAKPMIPNSTNPATRRGQNATDTVEKDVLKAFKNFADGEKQKTQERRNMSARVEKEMKLNDLKKFAANFKLKSEVPHDMLGILAKDKDKQDEIVEKSKRSLKEQAQIQHQQAVQQASRQQPLETSPTKRAVSAATGDVAAPRAINSARVEPATSAAPGGGAGGRGLRDGQPQGGFQGGRGNNRQFAGPSMQPNNARVPGYLGKNLIAIQQQRRDFGPSIPVPDQRATAGMGSGPGLMHSNRLNVEAMEFKPNPAATTFMPGTMQTSVSPVSTRKPSNASPPTESIFSKQRPAVEDKNKKHFTDFFNPIKRLKKSVEDENRQKEFAANGSIPQAYRTPPTWDVSKENEEKSYKNMYEQPTSSRHSASPSNGPVLNEQPMQYPNHGHPVPPTMSQQPSRQHHPHHMSGRQPSYEDHQRMHHSSSNSSVLPSPRFNHAPMMTQNGQVYPTPMQPYGQPMPQYMTPNGQVFMRPVQGSHFPPQSMPMAPPMIQNPSGGMMNMPIQAGMQMYTPSPSQVYVHPGPQAVGSAQAAYYSPRAAMMVPHGSQQGQQPHMVFVPQPGQPIFAQQPQGQIPHAMRGGVPMQPQGSYGSSPRMQNHYPTPGRGMPLPNQYQQQIPHVPGVIPPKHHMHGPEDMK